MTVFADLRVIHTCGKAARTHILKQSIFRQQRSETESHVCRNEKGVVFGFKVFGMNHDAVAYAPVEYVVESFKGCGLIFFFRFNFYRENFVSQLA